MGYLDSSKTWCLGPTRSLNPNGISIGLAVFARFTTVTHRQTDYAARSVTGRIYVRSTAKWTKNKKNRADGSETICPIDGHFGPFLMIM